MKAAIHHRHAHRPSEGMPKAYFAGYHYRDDPLTRTRLEADEARWARLQGKAARIERELVELENETRRARGLPAVERIEDVCFH